MIDKLTSIGRLGDTFSIESGTIEVASPITDHLLSIANPHAVTALQAGAVPTTRTVNSKALSSDISLTPADVGAASSTTAALSILIYDGTPSAGDLTTYDEIYTTPALCFAALPAIINHAVTITIRKADGSAYAAATLQRVVAGGSITIQGEYYYNNTVASAGSGTGKFNVIAAHSDLIQAGDKILLMKYSGTVGASTPSDAFIDTVAGVSGTEITLTTRTSDAFDSTWRYVIVRTICSGVSVFATNAVTIRGMAVSGPGASLNLSNVSEFAIRDIVVVDQSGVSPIRILNSKSTANPSIQYVGIKSTATQAAVNILNSIISWNNGVVDSLGSILVYSDGPAYQYLSFFFLRSNELTTQIGVCATNGAQITCSRFNIDGVSSAYKMATAIQAVNGAVIPVLAPTFGSNITTQKNPANWAASTDGSYIS